MRSNVADLIPGRIYETFELNLLDNVERYGVLLRVGNSNVEELVALVGPPISVIHEVLIRGCALIVWRGTRNKQFG
jgi:hypothetical protein